MNENLVFKEAEAHFKEHGDSVQFKSGHTPNATYDVIRGDLTAYAYSKLKDWMDAEDAVQESYCRVLAHAKPEGLNFGGLFKTTLDHIILDMFRRDAVKEHIREEDYNDPDNEGMSLIELAEGNEVEPELVLEIQEKVNFIMNQSNLMPQKSKGIIRMSLIFGYTNLEIAKILNIKSQKVANVVDYFRKRLEEKFDE